MNKVNIVKLLALLNSKDRPDLSRAGWVTGSCVFAKWKHSNGKDEHPSFGIKVGDNKKSIAKCLSCGWGGDLEDLIIELSMFLRKEPDSRYDLGKALQLIALGEPEESEYPVSIPDYGEKYESEGLHAYPEIWLDSFKGAEHFPEAVEYLEGRGLGVGTITTHDLRYDPKKHRICIPFRDFAGRLMGVQGRDISEGSKLRYLFYKYGDHYNMHAWLGEYKINLDKPVVLVEGPFDYMSVYRVYQNVMASFTSGLGMRKINRLKDCQEIITFYDFGAGGNAARAVLSGKGPENTRQSVRKALKGIPITHIIPTVEQDDAGNCSPLEIRELLEPHVKLK